MTDYTEEEKAAIRERARRALEGADEMLQRLAERAAGGAGIGEGEWRARQPPEPVPAPQRARQKPPQQSHEEWSAGWNGWAQKIADQRVGAALHKFSKDYSDALVEYLMEHLHERFTESRRLTNERVAGVEDHIAKQDSAVVELLGELERRLETLEQRAVLKPIKPKLVETTDGAA
jgi:hypothetical protein